MPQIGLGCCAQGRAELLHCMASHDANMLCSCAKCMLFQARM